jgi:hypothetical protein
MKTVLTAVICAVAVSMIPVVAMAQTDHIGKPDTIYADIAKIDDNNWSVTVSYTNDESVVGLSVPLKLDAGTTKILADSAVYTGGRVEEFAYKGFRPDTAVQAVLLGMIATLSSASVVLPAGSGRLVTVFVSSQDGKAIEKLYVDTTTLYPSNSLLVVADHTELTVEGDSVPPQLDKRREIIPVFVARFEE